MPPESGIRPSASVRLARTDELDVVRAVAVAAGRRFAESDDPRIARCADDPPPTVELLAEAVADERLWLAVAGDEVVGVLLALDLPGSVHVAEVAVRPERQGEGHGAALLDAVVPRAARRGVGAVTLTTFADVPFNRPWYERRGFRVLGDDELDGALAAIRSVEADHGLDPSLRVVMARPVPVPGTD